MRSNVSPEGHSISEKSLSIRTHSDVTPACASYGESQHLPLDGVISDQLQRLDDLQAAGQRTRLVIPAAGPT